MSLEFKFGVSHPYIKKRNGGLSVGLMNPACGQDSEKWVLGKGSYSQRGDFHLVKADNYVVGAAAVSVSAETLSATTQRLYQQLLDEYPQGSIYRIWHFIPKINEVAPGQLENYRSFCQGRSKAFDKYAKDELYTRTPAASGVGTLGDHLTIIYLAGDPPGKHIENPRQTPAYEYPEIYGPRPPVFSRATSINDKSLPTLFISGTASILASESMGSTIEEQLKITLENLAIIAAQAIESHLVKRRVRTYLRDASDYGYVKAELEKRFLSPQDEATYIVADICRKELLVEIEVTIGD
jgi:enamine deaminase RidA (YjgF/YER057c/UK114 family)